MKRTILSVLIGILLLSVPVRAAELKLASPSAILMEKTTGKVLYAQGEHDAREPASVTKIMTLLLTMEAIDSGALSYDDTVTASRHAASMGGSQIWLKENEQMSVRDLLKAVCVVSGNDAAVALAEHLCGSEEAFVGKMNRRAAELGMEDTHFVNCTGLPAQGHLTSAYDIALMSRELIAAHPDIRRFTTIWMDTLRDGASELVNTNKLVRFYEGTTGLKTGSTDSALYCLSATAQRGDMELIAVVLKGPTSADRFDDAKTLLNYGFSAYALVTVAPEEVLPPIDVTLGERGSVQPVLTEDAALLVEKERATGLRTETELLPRLAAPVYRGDRVGTLTVYDANGSTVEQLAILAGEDVGHVTFWQMLRRVWRTGSCAAE